MNPEDWPVASQSDSGLPPNTVSQRRFDPEPTRPDYVQCVAFTVDHCSVTWCSQPLTGWNFKGADHAALNSVQKGRLLICPKCSAAIVKAIQEGTWKGSSGKR